MVDEQEPAKRVVKRVVKKTVVRPAAPPAPTVRYGRPVTPSRRPEDKAGVQSGAEAGPQARTTTKVASRPTAKTAAPKSPRSPKAPRERPRMELRAKAGAAGHRVGDAWWVVADRTRAGARRAGTGTAARARAAASWRLPHLSNPYLAAAITGAVVAVAVLLLGLIALAIFEGVRGVSTGGGLWGGIAVIAIAALGGWLGAALLTGFGTSSGRLTSLLAVIVTIVAILGLFLEASQGALAFAIIPALTIASYVIAYWLIDLAENAPVEID